MKMIVPFSVQSTTNLFRATVDYTPGRPGIRTLSNGDPGWPDDPDEFWIESIEARTSLGHWTDVTELVEVFCPDLGDTDAPLVALIYTATLAQIEAAAEAAERERLAEDREWN